VQNEVKTLSCFNGSDYAPKQLKRLNSVSSRDPGLKSDVTKIVGNYMSMAHELKCDMFATA